MAYTNSTHAPRPGGRDDDDHELTLDETDHAVPRGHHGLGRRVRRPVHDLAGDEPGQRGVRPRDVVAGDGDRWRRGGQRPVAGHPARPRRACRMTAPVRLAAVRKTYGSGPAQVTALAGVSVEFPAGRVTPVMGPSGSGKSTLLHCAAGLDVPTSGTVTLVGKPIGGMAEEQLTELRRDHVSFVFQSYNLMPALSVWDNVVLPSLLAGREPDQAWATEVLRRVGLG